MIPKAGLLRLRGHELLQDFLAAGLEAKPTIHQSLANAIDEMGYTQRDGAKTGQETGGGGEKVHFNSNFHYNIIIQRVI